MGLSPRMRGNPRGRRRTPDAAGSIPAHAGEPWKRPPEWWTLRVYPRACGGTPDNPLGPNVVEGLSPRMRGNPRRTSASTARKGSIPAHAGEPRVGAAPDRRERVYPRACGGTSRRMGCYNPSSGLSPRMRGNPEHSREEQEKLGSIPAHAGEPRGARVPGARLGVYPRACGGTGQPLFHLRRVGGLSPRMRGNRIGSIPDSGCLGSIPAHAGEP